MPPYLTIPLMDDILIPFQNGKQIEPGLVLLYLPGHLPASAGLGRSSPPDSVSTVRLSR